MGPLGYGKDVVDIVMDFPAPVRTKGSSIRRLMRSTGEALRFIDAELAVELRSQARWKFARELLVVAERTQKQRDVRLAHRQLQQALRNDLLLQED